jgi:hypothetical protein
MGGIFRERRIKFEGVALSGTLLYGSRDAWWYQVSNIEVSTIFDPSLHPVMCVILAINSLVGALHTDIVIPAVGLKAVIVDFFNAHRTTVAVD